MVVKVSKKKSPNGKPLGDEQQVLATQVTQAQQAGPKPVASPAPAENVADKAVVTVTVKLPYLKQSTAYLDVMIGGAHSYLLKSSMVSYAIEGEEVEVVMPKTLARRRGLLDA